ncbi:hypothetical protein BCR44DRAFT_1067322 [Catenaria anguillulae PL171]|uniref:PH domain-containing protein n=1 Tax=Catenaria anguillulae PL171 TaxID=765915 RepID=A0A1Y2HPK6_9FUNG|nr:hypothetical protein BCR44DRAFT_1067322 [Catenaria anguillulae PL171]
MGEKRKANDSPGNLESRSASAMFSLEFPGMFVNVMTANADESVKWVDKINGTVNKAASTSKAERSRPS